LILPRRLISALESGTSPDFNLLSYSPRRRYSFARYPAMTTVSGWKRIIYERAAKKRTNGYLTTPTVQFQGTQKREKKAPPAAPDQNDARPPIISTKKKDEKHPNIIYYTSAL